MDARTFEALPLQRNNSLNKEKYHQKHVILQYGMKLWNLIVDLQTLSIEIFANTKPNWMVKIVLGRETFEDSELETHL